MVGKAVAGGFAAALLPASLVYVADKVPFARRQQAIANIMAAGAVGTVTGTIASGLLSRVASWRLVFLLTAPLAAALVVAFVASPSPSRVGRPAARWPRWNASCPSGGPASSWRCPSWKGRSCSGSSPSWPPPWRPRARAPRWRAWWWRPTASHVLAGSQVVKRAVRRRSVPPPVLMAIGGVLLVVANLVASAGQEVPNILAASALIGTGFALLHSTLQTWATELAPKSRGTATSLFVTAVFTGAAMGSGAVSGLAGAGRFRALFLLAAGVTVPVVVLAALGRARYKTPPERPVH